MTEETPMRHSVFQQRPGARKGARKGVKINIPDGLHADILSVKERLARTAPHLLFNAAALARAALEDAIQRAHGELDRLEREMAGCPAQDVAPEQARQ